MRTRTKYRLYELLNQSIFSMKFIEEYDTRGEAYRAIPNIVGNSYTIIEVITIID